MKKLLCMCAVLVSCSNSEPADPPIDLGVTPKADVGVDIASDAELDIAMDLSPDIEADAVLIPLEPTILPLGIDDVQIIGPMDEVDNGSELIESSNVLELFVDSTDIDFTRSQIFESRFEDAFADPQPIAGLSALPIVASPSRIDDGGNSYLYFVESMGLNPGTATVKRALRSDGIWSTQETVGLDGLWVLSWPKFLQMNDGSIGVAYRDQRSVTRFARSTDGVTFTTPVDVGPPGALPHVGQFQDGTLVFTFQEQTNTRPFVSSFRLSNDGGETWSPKQEVTDQSPNVHDTSIVRRTDGDVDLYYIYPASNFGFVLFRRHLDSAGNLGPEQRVTADELGEPSKPIAYRRADGSVMLTWAEISERDPVNFYPSEQRIVTATVVGDAPRFAN